MQNRKCWDEKVKVKCKGGGSVEVKQMSNRCQLLHISKISDEKETKSVKRMLMMLVRKNPKLIKAWNYLDQHRILWSSHFMDDPAAPTRLVTVRCQTLYLLEILGWLSISSHRVSKLVLSGAIIFTIFSCSSRYWISRAGLIVHFTGHTVIR